MSKGIAKKSKRTVRPGKKSGQSINNTSTELIDQEEVKRLSDVGLSQRHIARLLNCTQPNISYILRKVKEQEHILKDFTDKESLVLDDIRLGALSNLSPEVMRKAADDITSARDLKDYGIFYATMYDKSALEKGKATQIFSIAKHSDDIDEIQALKDELIELTEQDDGTYAPPDIVVDTSDNKSVKD